MTPEEAFEAWWKSLPIPSDDPDCREVGDDRTLMKWDALPVWLARVAE